jgi:ABC-type phosphate transport system substrate-binding protein
MNYRFARGLAGALLLAVPPAFAQHYVITNAATTLSPAEVREVFLGEKQFAGGTKLAPVDSLTGQEEFLAKVLAMDRVKYSAVWTKKAFREGLVQPPQKSGDTEVLDFVRRTPGAVGYVGTAPSGVNVVQKY